MYSKINDKFNCKKLIVFLICVNILENPSFGNRDRDRGSIVLFPETLICKVHFLALSILLNYMALKFYFGRPICLQACISDGESTNYFTKILIGGLFLR